MEHPIISQIISEPTVAYKEHSSRLGLVELSRNGLSKQALLKLSDLMGLTLGEMAAVLPITERTLQRRAPEKRLSQAVSQQLILLAELFEQASRVLGTPAKARQWLREPITGLGGITPLELLDTAIGIQLVADQLGHVQYGVYS